MVGGIRWLLILVVTAMLLLVPTPAQVVVVNLNPAIVTEGESVEVCLTLFDEGETLSRRESVTLTTNNSQADTNVIANSDYIPLQEEFVFTSTGPNKQCVALQTLRDNAVEDTEALNILVNTTGIEVRPSLLHLNILPADDKIVVDFVGTSYTVMEGDTTLDIDIRLTAGSIERAFPSSVEVEFTTLDITTEGNEDYVQPNSILFLAGDAVNTTRRLQLTVRDDQQVEGPETFHLVISDDFNPMHPVTTSGRGVVAVTVLDDDKASVGLQSPTMLSVLEGEDIPEICVQLVVDVLPLDRDVVVILDTEDITTDESDYTLSAALLTFQTGSTSGTTVCTALNIEPDDLEEKDEKVVVRVFPVAPDVVLDGVENSITLTILNDDVNCEALPTPSYPAFLDTRDGLIEGATATYSCAQCYRLIRGAELICMNGIWIGEEPSCTVIDCGEPPSLKNGDYNLANTTVNSTAVYFCLEGYHEREDTAQNEIECLSTGTWSQPSLECVPSDSTSAKKDGLGGGGIAAITVSALLIIVAVITLVLLLLGSWYIIYHHGMNTKRSGKYTVDNSDIDEPKPLSSSNSFALSPLSHEKEGFDLCLEEEKYKDVSSPTDV